VKLADGVLGLAATDLANHIACGHLTTLSLKVARGELATFTNFDPFLKILAERGREHEDAYGAHLVDQGLSLASAADVASPLDLMANGIQVITQARFERGAWRGRADFLVRVERPCKHWPWSYEVIDTKLASETRAGSVLQLCVYSELLAEVQGLAPDAMHIVKPGPGFPRESFRFDEYAAIYRAIKGDLERRIETTVATYPEPVPHCDSCNWRGRCDDERRADDHLSLVANLGRLQRRELVDLGINTLTALAKAPVPWPHKPERGQRTTYERLAHQARLQLAARSLEVPPFELLPLEPERGLARLPIPTPGDVFLDLEGDPFVDEAGREYLFGWALPDGGYEAVWALDDACERAGFEKLIDTLMARWATEPGMHVYHYAPYETTALKRLAGRYGTRAEELDRLLRGRRFVDLHSVTRQALRAGVESYSIKCLEPMVGYTREIDLDRAGASHRALKLALQRGLASAIEPAWASDVELYNRDDCVAARVLRDWLEARRAEVIAGGASIARPLLHDGSPDPEGVETRSEAAKVAARLLVDLPADRTARAPDQQARWLLGHLMEWYSREHKVAWWDFFRLAELGDEERLDEARAIAGLEHLETIPNKKIPIDRFRFPEQEVLLRSGDEVHVNAELALGTIVGIDLSARTVDVKKTGKTIDLRPTSLFAKTIVRPRPKDEALVRIGTQIADQGWAPAAEASVARDLMLKLRPRQLGAPGASLRHLTEAVDACAVRLALALDGAVLPIQGPPGSGKTETAAKMICALARAGRRVGVTATSHAVIANLVARAVELAQGGPPLRAMLRADVPTEAQHAGIEYASNASVAEKKIGELDVLGATAWQWARAGMANSVDVLIIDEAGQMSLADAIAVSGSARSLVLVGDPQQLEQPMQGTHPDDVAVSVLEHVLDGSQTIAPDRGLFLDETHRLHPSICTFTSEQFYERRLRPGADVGKQKIHTKAFDVPGLYWLPVEHDGNQIRCAEEAAAVAELVEQCLAAGTGWTRSDGEHRALNPTDVLIVAPYNAHVEEIRNALDARALGQVRVGTVDKFQGQQAAIAIYSMATSLPEDAPHGLSFLYDRHRLNVATSRARCASILVCSPALLRPDCRTPRHLHLASTIARYVELCATLGSGDASLPGGGVPPLRPDVPGGSDATHEAEQIQPPSSARWPPDPPESATQGREVTAPDTGGAPDLGAYLTNHQAKYFAYELTRVGRGGLDRLSMSLFDASVDLNPHQIEAALFALHSPLSKGVILADEVGLGKTIEAGIVLCQFWAERKRRLLIIAPASICKQWALELGEKFNLSAVVLDSKAYRESLRAARPPLAPKAIVIMSYNYANRIKDELKAVSWDLVVMDEAHKLRNSYRPSNKVGQGLRWATDGCRKLLLTATPLQNSLLELYGLSTLIDEHLFGDLNAFRAQYASAGSSMADLRQRLSAFCKRTLRNQVTEYIRYTERRAITRPFNPTDDEHALYEAVSAFLQRPDSYALPQRQRHLTALILRKLLASSSHAIAGTLDTLRERLESLGDEQAANDPEFAEKLLEAEEIEDELLDEILDDDEDDAAKPASAIIIDRKKLREETEALQTLATWARRIGIDTKTKTLLKALEIGFVKMSETGAARKALIFTESRRTQDYLKAFLEAHGFAGKVVVFNGTNTTAEATAIYEEWVKENTQGGRASGSRSVDIRTALVEHFRDHGTILLATEAAAEGINLQFCSLVINYDLPWNPQRIEQRIGRCHRYGQKHDVVVINFLNERNEADRRVLELLGEKFSLFDGVFGASDQVLGTIDSGVDFEKRILAIYQECRTPEAIDNAFRALQDEMDERIRARMDDTRRTLFEHFDEDVHQRLRLQLDDAKAQLDRFGQRFWALTRFMLVGRALFDNDALAFDLAQPPRADISAGRYHLISKSQPRAETGEGDQRGQFLYRISHPLGEHVIDSAKALETAPAVIVFDLSRHPARIHSVEMLKGKSGFLTLTHLAVESFEREEYLLFSGFDDSGRVLDQETMEKLFGCPGRLANTDSIPAEAQARLAAEAARHAKATVSLSLEQNNAHFNEAREKLEKWAEDMVLAAEQALADTKEKIKVLRRQARQAVTLEEQHEIQKQLATLEKLQRRQRQDIFATEDDIVTKRDALIEALEKRLSQNTTTETLFTIRWAVQ